MTSTIILFSSAKNDKKGFWISKTPIYHPFLSRYVVAKLFPGIISISYQFFYCFEQWKILGVKTDTLVAWWNFLLSSFIPSLLPFYFMLPSWIPSFLLVFLFFFVLSKLMLNIYDLIDFIKCNVELCLYFFFNIILRVIIL